MPLYSYHCKKCDTYFDKIFKMSEESSKAKCDCGKMANKHYTSPCLITDTSFCMTGKRDTRFSDAGDKKGVVIEGRKHWDSLVKSKGYMELSDSDVKKG